MLRKRRFGPHGDVVDYGQAGRRLRHVSIVEGNLASDEGRDVEHSVNRRILNAEFPKRYCGVVQHRTGRCIGDAGVQVPGERIEIDVNAIPPCQRH